MAQNPTADQMKRDAQAAGTEAKKDLHTGAQNIADEARKTADKLASNSGAERLLDRGSELADDAIASGREYADRARLEAERLYETGQQKAQEVAHYAEERYDEVSEMVRRNPGQALGIAAGIGFLFGLLLSRR
jgi:ElaB/YqjD/DUF883 family membrane-anchored ribosome-binding protein